ncbi:MAG: NUDIX domain-containing protein [Hyphomonadaceae bacterium]
MAKAKKSKAAAAPAIKDHGAETLYEGAVTVVRRTLDVPRQSRAELMRMERDVVRRKDAAAALVHVTDRNVIVLARLFRAAVFDRGESGWMTEVVAGKVEPGETPEECIRREIEEEVGYRARDLTPVASGFVSPGYSAEKIHVFYAPVKAKDLVAPDAHGVDEAEDIARVEFTPKEFFKALDKGVVQDAKSLIAGLWLRRHLRLAKKRKNKK